MPHSEVFITYLLSECMLLLLCSDLILRVSSIFAVGSDTPEKLRRASFMVLEVGRGSLGPFPGQDGVCCLPRASTWPDAEDSQPSVCRSQMLEMLLWLSVRAAPAAHGPDVQRNVSKAPSWPGSWVAGSRHNGHSTADRCLPFPIWPPPECTSLCG